MGFDVVSYIMGESSGGGGGSGIVLSGTYTPTASLGNDEDLYIQYAEYEKPPFDYHYGIAATYRKVGGVWVDYTTPTLPTVGVRVWTKSTGSNDASLWVQQGYFDMEAQQFVTIDEAVSYEYHDAMSGINLYDLAVLRYGALNWSIDASVGLTDGTNTYSAGTTIHTWSYSANYDVTVWKPIT